MPFIDTGHMDFDFPNIFLRLYRHRPQRNSTPTENFVTEAFAIVLFMQPAILRGFMSLVGENDVPDDVRISTQVSLNSCRCSTPLLKQVYPFLNGSYGQTAQSAAVPVLLNGTRVMVIPKGRYSARPPCLLVLCPCHAVKLPIWPLKPVVMSVVRLLNQPRC